MTQNSKTQMMTKQTIQIEQPLTEKSFTLFGPLVKICNTKKKTIVTTKPAQMSNLLPLCNVSTCLTPTPPFVSQYKHLPNTLPPYGCLHNLCTAPSRA